MSQVSRGLQSVSECGGSGGSHCAFPFLCKLLSNAIGLQCIPGDAVCCTELHIGAFEITTLHALSEIAIASTTLIHKFTNT